MMTLKELRCLTDRPSKKNRVPNVKELRKSNSKVVAFYESGPESWIRVYENGFACCCEGKKKTVFSIFECSYARWEFVNGESMILDGEGFENTAWNICLYLEGMRRIENNAENMIRRYTDNVPDEVVESIAMVEDQFSEVEWKDFLESVMKEFSPEQEMILKCCVLGDKHQSELAMELGTSQAKISRELAIIREIIARKLLL